jgi:hypothetical protein
MRILSKVLMAALVALSFSQCKKDDDDHKLENPFGFLLLGSDTTLEDGRYVIRTPYGCSGYANMLHCDNADEVLTMNALLYPTDHITDVDTLAVWYVKKVRYISPDPDYALAFGYRIYQYRPNGAGYRFLSFYSFGTPDPDASDEIGDGGGPSVKASVLQRENYPRDPNVPNSLATSNGPLEQDTRWLFQFYGSEANPGHYKVKAGGLRSSTNDPPTSRWKLCTAYWDDDSCDGNALPPHFRSEYSGCELVDDGGGSSTRCYIDELIFERVY